MEKLKERIKCPYCGNLIENKLIGECPFCNNTIFVIAGKAQTREEFEFEGRTEELITSLKTFKSQYHFPMYLLEKSISIEDKMELVKNDIKTDSVLSEVIYYESLSIFHRISLFVIDKILNENNVFIKNVVFFLAFIISIGFLQLITGSVSQMKINSIDLEFLFWIWLMVFPYAQGVFVGEKIKNYKQQEEFRCKRKVNYLEYILSKNINSEILFQFLIEKILDHRIEWKQESKKKNVLIIKGTIKFLLIFLTYSSFIFILFRYFSLIFLNSLVPELWRKIIFSSSLLILAIAAFNIGINPPNNNNNDGEIRFR